MKCAVFVFVLGTITNQVSLEESLPPPCFSEIYCYGRIIENVMEHHIFNDSKTFVDLKLKKPPNETLKFFDDFMLSVNNTPTNDQLSAWVDVNFDPKGSELELWTPIDHKTNFEALNRINDKNLKKFASDLNDIWIELSRRMKDEVKVSQVAMHCVQFSSVFNALTGTSRADFNHLRSESVHHSWRPISRILLLGQFLDNPGASCVRDVPNGPRNSREFSVGY